MYNAHTVFTQQSLTGTHTLIGHGISLPFMALEASLCTHKNSPLVHKLDKMNAILCCHSFSLRFIIQVICFYPFSGLYSGLFLSAFLIQIFAFLHPTFVTHIYVYNSYFTDPLHELSRIEYEIGQYNTTQYKLVSPTVMSSLQYE